MASVAHYSARRVEPKAEMGEIGTHCSLRRYFAGELGCDYFFGSFACLIASTHSSQSLSTSGDTAIATR
jgi:hypothetical protein